MRVSVNNDLCHGERGMQAGRCGAAELVAVRHRDVETVQLDVGHPWQAGTKLESIDISVNRRQRSERLERGEDVLVADIAGMEDVINPGKDLEDLGPELAVGVRDDA